MALENITQKVHTVVTQVLREQTLRNVAWRGEGGEAYYKANFNHSRSLAALASLAEDDVSLCHLAAGWYRAHAVMPKGSLTAQSQHLVIICHDLSAKLLDTLERLQQGRLEAVVLFFDYSRRYVNKHPGRGSEPWFYTYPGVFAQARGLFYAPPVDCDDFNGLNRALRSLVQKKGLKILHILGSDRQPEVDHKSPSANSSVSSPSKNKSATIKTNSSLAPTFEELALKYIAFDLKDQNLVSCLWTCRKDPGPFKSLRGRLQLASIDGVILQAIGMAVCGVHPLIVISAADLPKVLNELFNTASFPITILLTDAGLVGNQEEPLSSANFHDLAILRSFANIHVAVPSDEEEARSMLLNLLSAPEPGLLRLSSSSTVGLPKANQARPKEKLCGRCLVEGSDLAFVCLGSVAYHAILAAHNLKTWGFKAAVYDMAWLNPFDTELLQKAIQTGRIITVEEHSTIGGLASTVSEYLAQNDLEDHVQLRTVGLINTIDSPNLEDHGISMEELTQQAKMILGFKEDEL